MSGGFLNTTVDVQPGGNRLRTLPDPTSNPKANAGDPYAPTMAGVAPLLRAVDASDPANFPTYAANEVNVPVMDSRGRQVVFVEVVRFPFGDTIQLLLNEPLLPAYNTTPAPVVHGRSAVTLKIEYVCNDAGATLELEPEVTESGDLGTFYPLHDWGSDLAGFQQLYWTPGAPGTYRRATVVQVPDGVFRLRFRETGAGTPGTLSIKARFHAG